MRSFSTALASLAALIGLAALGAAGSAAADDAAGRWHVAGNVDSTKFTLDCHFAQAGEALTGACVDGPTGNKDVPGGRSHPLLKGHASGDQISWTYETNKSFFHFKVDYTGVRHGDHASGTLSAVGKTGAFTADRVP